MCPLRADLRVVSLHHDMVQRDKHMDQANSRLLTAFDPLQNRMFQAAAVLETAIDNILSFIPGYERWSWWSNNVTRLAYAKVTMKGW